MNKNSINTGMPMFLIGVTLTKFLLKKVSFDLSTKKSYKMALFLTIISDNQN